MNCGEEKKPLIDLKCVGVRRNKELQGGPTELKLSDGKWYSLKHIVALMGNKITEKALSIRVRDHGIDYEYLFYPKAKRGHSLDGKRNGSHARQDKSPKQEKKPESGRRKLSDIPGPTYWELKYLGN